ncbi:sortase [Patescibacteria group bacterium]|nr:sortase [Patescibacteria group bacterium]
MTQKIKIKELLGCMPGALLGNFVLGAIFLALGTFLGGPKIYIELASAVYVFLALLILYLLITWWSIFALAKNKSAQNLATSGPYKFVRHPMYSAVIFLLNPALAILFRSWFLILALIPIYFLWKKSLRSEENFLEENFDEKYFTYQNKVWPLFPNLHQINKFLFYSLTAIAVFLIAFVSLNFSAVYLRWVFYEKNEKISYDTNASKQLSPADFQRMFQGNNQSNPNESSTGTSTSYKVNYTELANSIAISKINIKAPLVFSTGTSQKELNDALNQGVIIYPGSALPGQDGEVFLSGHSSIFPWVKTQYGQVFTLLDKLEPGDIISLVYDHFQYDYRVIGKKILLPKEVNISNTKEPILTLMTCWPIGTALKRLVVRAELIK